MMPPNPEPGRRPVIRGLLTLHRWLGVAAAAIWMVQAVTGVLLAFHFEIEDAALTTAHRPTDVAAIERRIDALADAGGKAKTHWIWTTAGLPDRYIILHDKPSGITHKAYVDGGGEMLRDRAADDYSFLGLMREIHLTLVAGTVGHWILAIAGVLLLTNLITGLVLAWPKRRQWRTALTPTRRVRGAARAYSWHRAVGLWAVVPAIVVVGTGTLILFEHDIRELAGIEENALPPIAARAPPVGFARARAAAVAAIPGSRFVGGTMPTPEDASYYIWVREPGELYRQGYGSSLVIVDASDGSVRGAWPASKASAANAVLGSFYPLHTGEAGRTPGRILTMALGLWLIATTGFGMLLWWRRRPRRKPVVEWTGDRQ